MSGEPADPPRSLAEELRGRSDEALAGLLRIRPDLLSPLPTDIAQLAARASTHASVVRALERLDRHALQVLDALVLLPDPTAAEGVRALLGSDEALPAALARLRDAALVWGPDDALRVVRSVRAVIGPSPADLGPPYELLLPGMPSPQLAGIAEDLGLPAGSGRPATGALLAYLTDPATLDALIAAAPAMGRAALDDLAEGPPYGRLEQAQRVTRTATARTPIEWLLARGLLLPVDPVTVVLPREVGLRLRGGHVHPMVEAAPPPLRVTPREPALVDRTAAGAAFTAVRQVEDLLELWGVEPPAVLRSGGLGVRELRRVAGTLDVDESAAALLVECAYAAGLLGAGGATADRWLPTPAYDAWRARPTQRRWVELATAWLETSRVATLVGRRDDRDRPLTALGAGVDRVTAPDVRRATLGVLAGAGPYAAVPADDVAARLVWQRPRHGGWLRDLLVPATLQEAELLGVTGRGAVSAAGRAVLAGDESAAAQTLAPLLPEPLDHVLLQADLTAVAPGPLTTDLAHELRLVAEVESTGGATVYRFTDASVRRALDAGRTAADLHALLSRHSRTPVPQPLHYLVDDVARRHGRIRIGAASAYVRCDDEAVLSELLADRRSGQLRLRRLAGTVLAAQVPTEVVLERLRAMGYAPAAESPDGNVLVRRPDVLRTPPRQRPPRLLGEPPPPEPRLADAAVRALRAGDRASAAATGPVVRPAFDGSALRTSTAATLAVLQDAVADGRPLWIGYVNAQGSATERIVEPLALEGGYLTAYDHRREEVRTFAVHRITGVAELDDEPA
jgi:Helicase conserved C-terminal domain/WYL domain